MHDTQGGKRLMRTKW